MKLSVEEVRFIKQDIRNKGARKHFRSLAANVV